MHTSWKTLLAGSALAVAGLVSSLSAAEKTVKVGVLHSLSGTMAISETSLRDVLLFTFDEINAAGGIKVGGDTYKIEPVVVDGASNWPLFAEKAKQLLEQDKVAVTFGCWTSVSRKSVLPPPGAQPTAVAARPPLPQPFRESFAPSSCTHPGKHCSPAPPSRSPGSPPLSPPPKRP